MVRTGPDERDCETCQNPHPEVRAQRASKDGGELRALGHPSRLAQAGEHLRMRSGVNQRSARDISGLAQDRAQAIALNQDSVSRETWDRLDQFVALLQRWQKTINLVAPSTLSTLWTRHVADSLQLPKIAPQARVWVDLGSGAGFPGLVLACALADRSGGEVHLVESNQKK